MCEGTAPHGGLMSQIPCGNLKASIQLAGFAIKLGPQSNGTGRLFGYGSLADMLGRGKRVRFTPQSRHAQRRRSMSAKCQKRTLAATELNSEATVYPEDQ